MEQLVVRIPWICFDPVPYQFRIAVGRMQGKKTANIFETKSMSSLKQGLEGRGFVESGEWAFRGSCKRTKASPESVLENFIWRVTKNRTGDSNGSNDQTFRDHSQDTLRDLQS